MDQNNLFEFLDEILMPLGYTRSETTWSKKGEQVDKIVNLRQTTLTEKYYILYGFNINHLEVGNRIIHISQTLESDDYEVNELILELLDIDNKISDKTQKKKLLPIIQSQIIDRLESVSTEKELKTHLKGLPHLIGVPYEVKSYFDIYQSDLEKEKNQIKREQKVTKIKSHKWDYTLYKVDDNFVISVVFYGIADHSKSFIISKPESKQDLKLLADKIRNNYREFKGKEVDNPSPKE